MKRTLKDSLKSTFSTRNLTMMAALIAIQIVLSRVTAIQVAADLRLSFETIPLALAGMWLGPLLGALVAFLADIIGTVLSGYGVWFPPLVLGPMFFAWFCGICTKYVCKSSLAETKDTWKVLLITVVGGIINTYGIGLLASTWYSMLFAGKEGAFWALVWANLLQRLVSKPLTIIVSSLAVSLVNRAAYKPVVRQILQRAA